MNILPILNSDSYKQFHYLMYPAGLILLYSNMTPRKSRIPGVDKAVFFGLQYYLKEYAIKQWNELFFQVPLENVVKEYKRFHKYFSGVDIDTKHIEYLHSLQHLPISIKALEEGTEVPMRVPFYTIVNTDKKCAWLVNFLETQMSTVIWDLVTNATISRQYRKLFDQWALKTTGTTTGVQWQGHDFAQRGRSSVESTMNQAGHLLSFTGTDTIPAVLMLEKYYNANMENELIGGSVPATEHSVMTSYGKEEEIDAFKRLLDLFPTGILSVVSDSFDLWQVLTKFMPELKERILARDGKLVLRPDSGDPVDIICGLNTNPKTSSTVVLYEDCGKSYQEHYSESQHKGVIELLWDVFGGTVNDLGYKVLDPHVGAIYGDAITIDRAKEIFERLEAKGFASTNIVLGIGSYTFNMQTRDTLGIAVKSTYCEVKSEKMDAHGAIEKRNIFKDPITDDGTKKSAKGLMRVFSVDETEIDREGNFTVVGSNIVMYDEVVGDVNENIGLLKEVFRNGVLLRDFTLSEIRNKLNG